MKDIKYDIPIERYFKNKVDSDIRTNEYLFWTASKLELGLDELLKKIPTETVDINKIVPTQSGLHSYKLDAIQGEITDLPLLCERDGLYYVEDGHHRIARMIIEGKPIVAKVYPYTRMMFANNGKPSNLNEQQHKLVRTHEFKTWFGDWENDPENSSKVVDENGEPLVVYHGSEKEFYEFKHYPKKTDDHLGYKPKFWFTSDYKLAKMY